MLHSDYHRALEILDALTLPQNLADAQCEAGLLAIYNVVRSARPDDIESASFFTDVCDLEASLDAATGITRPLPDETSADSAGVTEELREAYRLYKDGAMFLMDYVSEVGRLGYVLLSEDKVLPEDCRHLGDWFWDSPANVETFALNLA